MLMDFNDLLKFFEDNKGTNNIELSNNYNDDKYSIQIYDNGVEGNFIINDIPKLHIIFYPDDELAVAVPCEDNGVYHLMSGFNLVMFCEISIINDLIDQNFLNALNDYVSKK